MSVYASDIADDNEGIAFPAFDSLIRPALRAVSRAPLNLARHAGDPCLGITAGTWCAECEATVDEVLSKAFTRLRHALAGKPACTRDGTPVRELAAVATHLRSPAARYEHVRDLAPLLASEKPPPWLRALRAQLVYYPVQHLEERVRRDDASARGGSARPDRDLRKAAWATPLRADPVTLDLLLVFIGRLRHRAPDPYAMPDNLLTRHALDPTTASRRLESALTRLRALRPQFYAANITAQLIPDTLPDGIAYTTPEDHALAADATRAARTTLTRLLRAQRSYRPLVEELCAAGDPITHCTQKLGLTPLAASRFIRHLAYLADAAGLIE